MDYRQLGGSGLKVPVLTLGTGTFGGSENFKSWGASDVAEALRGLPDDGLPVLIAGSLYLAGKVLAVNGEIPD